MYRLVANSKMPRFLKALIYILLTITCVYWIGYFTYKILDAFRVFLHYVSTKEHWWAFLICLAILAVGAFLLAQFVFDLGWWEMFVEFLSDKYHQVVNWFKETIIKIIE